MTGSRDPSVPPARPTLEMVAAEAGVSRGTASRALGDHGNVSPAARKAVLAAAQAVGYRPNLAARSLARGRSGTVGLIVSESTDRLFNDPFFPQIARGAHRTLSARGLQLVLSLSQTPEERTQTVQFAAGHHLDGVLLISVRGGDPLHEALVEAGIPVVFCGRVSRERTERGLRWVDADNRGGARLAVAHLAETGRRRIATIAGPRDLAVGRDRLAGWRDALTRSQQDPAAGLVHPGDFSVDSGRTGVHLLLARHPDIDAVFAASDLMALGALQGLRDRGRRVPDDVAVVGFDDLPAAACAEPPLTTVHQPVEAMGRRMAELLLHKLDNSPAAQPSAVLRTRLIIREST